MSEATFGGEQSAGPRGADLQTEGARVCPACGAEVRRDGAHFCATCGRHLGEDYFPTDSLRASYRFERTPEVAPARQPEAGVRGAHVRPRPAATRSRGGSRAGFAARGENGAAATAAAFVTYALVPYLGILFCPGALLMGGVGLLRARRAPHLGGLRASAISITLGLAILFAQLVLWWVLYKVPEWSQGGNF